MAELQGVGVYAEFGNNSGVSQLLITPDGRAEDSTFVNSCVVRRLFLPNTTKEPEWMITELVPLSTITEADPELIAAVRFKDGSVLLDQYMQGSWEHLGTPFFVEVTDKDLQDIVDGQSPQKLLYRVRQCRLGLGYPEEGKAE